MPHQQYAFQVLIVHEASNVSFKCQFSTGLKGITILFQQIRSGVLAVSISQIIHTSRLFPTDTLFDAFLPHTVIINIRVTGII